MYDVVQYDVSKKKINRATDRPTKNIQVRMKSVYPEVDHSPGSVPCFGVL